MNAKIKCKRNEGMTVKSLTPKSQLLSTDRFCQNSSKAEFDTKTDKLSFGLLPLQLKKQKNVSPVESRFDRNDRTDSSSSIILRQKLLHRNKNGSVLGSANVSKSGRKSYSRSHNNGFKFHNFVVNEDKRSCLEEQDGTKKITVSHWKRPLSSQPVVIEQSSPTPSHPSHSILETLLAPNSANTPTIEEQQRVSKRKPLHVRRVLRQQQHQSMEVTEPEPQDEPLDLSFKKYDFNMKSESQELNSRLALNRNEILVCESPSESHSVQHLIKSVNRSAAQASAIISSVKCPNSANFSSNSLNDSSIAQKQINCGVSAKQQKLRQTQRSLIKKQLEETFKQNGFLVKVLSLHSLSLISENVI